MNFKWATDGKINVKCYSNSIPEGFKLGFTLKQETLERKEFEKTVKENKKKKFKESISSLPLSERKAIKKEMEEEKQTSKKLSVIMKEYSIDSLDKDIQDKLRNNLDADSIFNLLKKENAIINDALYDYITESALLYQLKNMPIYIDTIVDSLKVLYKKNHILQKERQLRSYFTKYYSYYLYNIG